MTGVAKPAVADVYVGDVLAGQLERTQHGARFSYDAGYLAARGPAVAFTLPLREAPYETHGVNLHTFFAGLLPEGLRLQALVRRTKTSEDDLLSLLVMSGADCIGDVAVTRRGQRPFDPAPEADVQHPQTLAFGELFEHSLRYGDRGGEVSIPGVQHKVSASMVSFPLRGRRARGAFILKLAPADFPRLVENEAFFMAMARGCGLEVARAAVVHDIAGVSGLLVERFDRVPTARGLTKLHQEDLCQLLDRYPADKYNLTLADGLQALEVCSAPLVERLKLLRLYAFSYLVAGGDLHAKNISLLRNARGRLVLAPGYDIISTLPYGDRHMALSVQGRDDNIHGAHLIAEGQRHGVRAVATGAMLSQLLRRAEPFVSRLEEIGLDSRRSQHLARVMQKRAEDLKLA
ncbi:MAG: HipA domain-containing protein [Myxococcales bacterium]|nr:HipA domain-containing protein [Myxococcales bacterium]